MRTIILSAGQGIDLDGFNKLLIKCPKRNKTILDLYLEYFKGTKITVVLGYRAINVIHNYPKLDFIYNKDWNLYGNSYSLGLALNEEPCYVISGDLFFNKEIIKKMENINKDILVCKNTENRSLKSVNVKIKKKGGIEEIYMGRVKDPKDQECMGIFKIISKNILKEWKKNCLKKRNVFAAENLNFAKKKIHILNIDKHKFNEINTPQDYLNMIKLND